MACDGCNKNSKIAFGFAVCLAISGVLVFIIALVTAGSSVTVGFEAENTQSVTLTTSAGSGDLGFSLHIKSADYDDCGDILAATRVQGPSGSGDAWLLGDCMSEQEEWEKTNDPPLRKLGHFFLHEENSVKVYGDYIITSSAPLWIVDSAEELGEAVGGLFASLGIVVVAIVLFVVSCILCCVGCCCMGGKANSSGKAQQGTVIGTPAGASA